MYVCVYIIYCICHVFILYNVICILYNIFLIVYMCIAIGSFMCLPHEKHICAYAFSTCIIVFNVYLS